MSGNTSTDIWIAGAFAAFTVDLLVYPLDTLKTRLQSSDYRRIYVNESTNTLKKGVLFRGLYQGLTSVVLATLPASGAFFTTYEGAKSLFTNHGPTSYLPTPVAHSAASAVAELVSCAIITPAEVIKQNAQMVTQASVASARASATRQTLRRFRSNPLALWRGYSALAGRNLPFIALQFPLFERFKAAAMAWREEAKVRQGGTHNERWSLYENGLITAVTAGTAGAISAVVTTPIDVVKTRIMLAAASTFADQGGSPSKMAVDAARQGNVKDAVQKGAQAALGSAAPGSPPVPKHLSSMDVARGIIEEQGWKGLWRGGALRAGWTMLGSGLYLGMYESGRVYLERRREDMNGD